MVDRIEDVVAELLDDGKFVVTLGGEHTVAVGAVRAHVRRYPDLSVLAIDAHADLRDEYLDSRYNHACTLRRDGRSVPGRAGGNAQRAVPDQLEFIRERDLTFLTPRGLSRAAGRRTRPAGEAVGERVRGHRRGRDRPVADGGGGHAGAGRPVLR